MPYVETTFAGSASGALLPPSSTQANTDGSSRRNAVATRETWVARPVRPACSTASASNPGSTSSGVSVTMARVTTARPPMWASGRQASHVWRVGSTASCAEVARADASTASCVSTTPFGCPDVPDVATTSASPSSTGNAVGQGVLLAVGADDPSWPQRVEHDSPGGGG